MIVAKFRHRYPQGSLVSELIEIDRGTYIVKALVEIDNIVLATGLAGAATVEAAEDAAKERAIATLFLEDRPNTEAIASTPQTSLATPRQSTETKPQVESGQNVNFSKPESTTSARPLTPVTVPLKSVAETNNVIEPEAIPAKDPEPAPSNSLFGDTFTAQTPTIEPVMEENSTPVVENANSGEVEAMDFNEIKQKTDIEIKRLSWTKDQGKDFLMSRYGKRSRLHLTDEQLLEFLRYLETLPNPVK